MRIVSGGAHFSLVTGGKHRQNRGAACVPAVSEVRWVLSQRERRSHRSLLQTKASRGAAAELVTLGATLVFQKSCCVSMTAAVFVVLLGIYRH